MNGINDDSESDGYKGLLRTWHVRRQKGSGVYDSPNAASPAHAYRQRVWQHVPSGGCAQYRTREIPDAASACRANGGSRRSACSARRTRAALRVAPRARPRCARDALSTPRGARPALLGECARRPAGYAPSDACLRGGEIKTGRVPRRGRNRHRTRDAPGAACRAAPARS
jgi:hypothetical protein